MLISFDSNFIFVATQKTASTSIEAALQSRAQVRLLESRFGKHMTVADMMTNLGWLFREKPLQEFFIFGVIRDPVDFTLSLFNSHKGPGFANMPHVYTGEMTFQDFLDRWVPANSPQIVPQHRRFLDGDGRIGANYIITYDRLAAGLSYVGSRIGGERLPKLPRLNRTPGGMTRRDLRPAEMAWIQQHFRDDYSFMSKCCDVPMSSFSEPFGRFDTDE